MGFVPYEQLELWLLYKLTVNGTYNIIIVSIYGIILFPKLPRTYHNLVEIISILWR